MMKFVVQQTKNGCRLGSLTNFGEAVSKPLDTPALLLYTRGGSAPNLTRDALDLVENLPSISHMPISHLARDHESIAEYGKGVANFSGMEDFAVYCSIQDPVETVPSGYNDKNGVSTWSKAGKLKLDIEQHTRIMEAYKPTLYQALCDSDTDKESSGKRLKKSVDRTLSFLDESIKKRDQSETLKNTDILGVIEGGYDVKERTRSATETAKRPVAGFCIEGFHRFGPESETFQIKDIKEIIQATLNALPEDKMRMFPGPLPPDGLLEAIELGFDIFDTSYPHLVGERGSALVFNYTMTADSVNTVDGCVPHEEETQQEEIEQSSAASDSVPCRPFEISLKDKRYAEDFSPLLAGCGCHACQNHTRAYVHHLLNTSELLASILLTIHNFHQYFGFAKEVRSSIERDQFSELQKLILKQR